MPYPIAVIASGACGYGPPVSFQQALWGKGRPPRTTLRLGYKEGVGLLVGLTAEEENPLRRYDQPQDPVYLDSAVEFFMTLEQPETQERVSYLNFECNANGAMLAHWGKKGERQPILPAEYQAAEVCATRTPESWTIALTVPLSLLERVFGIKELVAGDMVYFNAYKISEEPVIEHYSSYFPVTSDAPDFHRPQDFGLGRLEK